MILICGMATYGAYKVNKQHFRPDMINIHGQKIFFYCLCPLKQHAAWIIPFFCYQVFDFALNTLVAISVVVYPNTVQDYLQQLVSITV